MLRYTMLEASLSFTPARLMAPISAKDYVVVLLIEKAMISLEITEASLAYSRNKG